MPVAFAYVGGTPSIIAPAVNIRGPVIEPRFIAFRSASAVSVTLCRSRTVVTPQAT